jgi:hypothetical protein
MKMKDTSMLPKLWTVLEEDSGFIANTRDYWISSIPFNTIIFISLHLLFRLMRKFNMRLSENLSYFQCFTILFVNLFLQNIQLLTFRTFQQILFNESPNCQYYEINYFANLIVCYITFFFVFIVACAGQYIVLIFTG